MLARGTDELRRAQAERTALAAINIYNVEYVVAVVEAAEAADRPVLLQIPGATPRHVRDALAAAAVAAADAAAVPVGVHLDHSRDRSEVRECVELGFTSVMIDGSHLDVDSNVALTAAVVHECHRHGVWVEGELGAIAGDEHQSLASAPRRDAAAPNDTAPNDVPDEGSFTDPAAAAEFCARTGVDALAVAVGTVHGFTPFPTAVDIDHLARIRATLDIPLVLHGASGVDEANITAAIAAGIAKINVNAELRRTYLDALTAVDGDNVAALRAATIAALARHAEAKIRHFARL